MPLPFVLTSKCIMEKKGASRVSVPRTAGQVNGTFGITLSGFLTHSINIPGENSIVTIEISLSF